MSGYCASHHRILESPSRKSWEEIVDVAKRGGEESQDMDLGEIQELTATTPEELTRRQLGGDERFRARARR